MQNILVQRRLRKQLVIPNGLATLIVKDNSLLKPIALYLELKPLFYSSVIVARKNKKSLLYNDIATYCGISSASVQQKIKQLIKLDLVWFDESNNLCLASLKKLCELFSLSSKQKHKLENTYLNQNKKTKAVCSTELILRTLAIKENFYKQEITLHKKLFAHEIKDLESIKKRYPEAEHVSPKKAWDRYMAWITSNLSHNDKHLTTLYKRLMQKPESYLAKHYKKMYEDRTNGVEHFTINPEITLSCQGVASLFKLNSISTGYYWQQQLAQHNLLNIVNDRIQYIPHNCMLVHLQQSEGNRGVFHVNRKKKISGISEKKFFYTQPNLLQPLI